MFCFCFPRVRLVWLGGRSFFGGNDAIMCSRLSSLHSSDPSLVSNTAVFIDFDGSFFLYLLFHCAHFSLFSLVFACFFFGFSFYFFLFFVLLRSFFELFILFSFLSLFTIYPSPFHRFPSIKPTNFCISLYFLSIFIVFVFFFFFIASFVLFCFVFDHFTRRVCVFCLAVRVYHVLVYVCTVYYIYLCLCVCVSYLLHQDENLNQRAMCIQLSLFSFTLVSFFSAVFFHFLPRLPFVFLVFPPFILPSLSVSLFLSSVSRKK